jgi:hypothetical protein
MLIMAIDPGNKGAMAYYETTGTLISIKDMPVREIKVGNKNRIQIDAMALYTIFSDASLMGVEMVVMEQIGGRPRQSAPAAFTLGHGVGMIYMACVACGLRITQIPPQVWKRKLKVSTDDESIAKRADELLPGHGHLWRGPKGGVLHDRAEAAMIAVYYSDYLTERAKR